MLEKIVVLFQRVAQACRGHHELVLENLAVRQQLNTLKRTVTLKGAKTWSRRQNVLANHATETVATLNFDLVGHRGRRDGGPWRVGRSEAQCSMRSVDVVVVDEDGEHALEVPFVQNQHPVETL